MFSLCMLFVFFFFKQKTAYEMRISDWSSDVCSSDLLAFLVRIRHDDDLVGPGGLGEQLLQESGVNRQPVRLDQVWCDADWIERTRLGEEMALGCKQRDRLARE